MQTLNKYLTENDHPTEYDAIIKTMQHYIDGSRAGNSELMHPGFPS